MAVVGVHGQAGRSQNHRHSDRAAGGVIHTAAHDHAVDVELHRCASLGGLDDVFDHPAGQAGVVIGGVHRGRTRAVGETGDVRAEGGVLAGFLADRGDVDFRASDFETPLAHRAHSNRSGVGDACEVGAETRRLSGGSCSRTTGGGADGHDAGAGVVGLDEIRTSGDCVGGGCASRIGQGHRVIDLETEIGANGDVGTGSGEGGGGQRGDAGASGRVVEGAGGAREDGGHW